MRLSLDGKITAGRNTRGRYQKWIPVAEPRYSVCPVTASHAATVKTLAAAV
jgi:hypothetical protein